VSKTEAKRQETTLETEEEEEPQTEEEVEEVTEEPAIEKTEEPQKEAAEEGEEKPEEAVPAEEKVEKPKKEKEEDIVEERFYTIPLRRAWIYAPRKRAPKAMRIIRSFIQKHMKIGTTKKEEEDTEEEKEERLVISTELNEKIWTRGIQKPPRRIKVRVVKDSEGTVTVYPAEGD
jgi:large subunit ribosomal protein L31e